MKRNTTRVESVYVGNYQTPYLGIEHTLMGRDHKFVFDGFKIQIKLPLEDLQKVVSRSPGVDDHFSHITAYGHRENRGLKIHLLAIEQISLTVEMPNRVTILKEMLKRSPNQYDLLSDHEVKGLNELANTYKLIADKAFAYWLAIIRWRTQSGYIGRSLKHSVAMRPPRLKNRKTKKSYWLAPGLLTSIPIKALTKSEWLRIQKSLRSNESAPLFYEFYYDGIEHKRTGDEKRTIVDFAMACEIFLRSKVISTVPIGLSAPLIRYIDLANTNQLVNHFFPSILSVDGLKTYKSLRERLEKLFASRNDVLHSGIIKDRSPNFLDTYQNVTRDLLELADNKKLWL